MKKQFSKKQFIVCNILLVLLSLRSSCFAQQRSTETEDKKISATILHLDSLFWNTYNTCATGNGGEFIADGVKFYHDKGGITEGKAALVASIKNNICGNPNQRVRREAIAGTVNVYPLRSGNAVYGAIISGEHYFYVREGNKPEKREGLARFEQLWLLKDNEWRMEVILSYDHGSAARKKS